MTLEEFVAKWSAEADSLRHRGAVVPGASLVDDVLADFRAVMMMERETLLTLTQAASESGSRRTTSDASYVKARLRTRAESVRHGSDVPIFRARRPAL